MNRPTFAVMCGISGSGKSTYAEKLKSDALSKNLTSVIVSTDEIREELWGDANDQQQPQKVFDEAYRRLDEAFRQGIDFIIFDATNLSHREHLLNKFKKYQAINIVYVIDTSLETAIQRQSLRDRKVPEEVIRRQYNTLKSNMPSTSEGFVAVIHV